MSVIAPSEALATIQKDNHFRKKSELHIRKRVSSTKVYLFICFNSPSLGIQYWYFFLLYNYYFTLLCLSIVTLLCLCVWIRPTSNNWLSIYASHCWTISSALEKVQKFCFSIRAQEIEDWQALSHESNNQFIAKVILVVDHSDLRSFLKHMIKFGNESHN